MLQGMVTVDSSENSSEQCEPDDGLQNRQEHELNHSQERSRRVRVVRQEDMRRRIGRDRDRSMTQQSDRSRLGRYASDRDRSMTQQSDRSRLGRYASDRDRSMTQQSDRSRLGRYASDRDRSMTQQSDRSRLGRYASDRDRSMTQQSDRSRLGRYASDRDRSMTQQSDRSRLGRYASDRDRSMTQQADRSRLGRYASDRDRSVTQQSDRSRLGTYASDRDRSVTQQSDRSRLGTYASDRDRSVTQQSDRSRLGTYVSDRDRSVTQQSDRSRLRTYASDRDRPVTQQSDMNQGESINTTLGGNRNREHVGSKSRNNRSGEHMKDDNSDRSVIRKKECDNSKHMEQSNNRSRKRGHSSNRETMDNSNREYTDSRSKYKDSRRSEQRISTNRKYPCSNAMEYGSGRNRTVPETVCSQTNSAYGIYKDDCRSGRKGTEVLICDKNKFYKRNDGSRESTQSRSKRINTVQIKGPQTITAHNRVIIPEALRVGDQQDSEMSNLHERTSNKDIHLRRESKNRNENKSKSALKDRCIEVAPCQKMGTDQQRHNNRSPKEMERIQLNSDFEHFIKEILKFSHLEDKPITEVVCVFLARNQENIIKLVKEVGTGNKDLIDSFIVVLHSALGVSPLCSKQLQQIFTSLKACTFFETPLVNDVVKGLAITDHHNPDESDVSMVLNLLDIMMAMIRAGVLSQLDILPCCSLVQRFLKENKCMTDVWVSLQNLLDAVENEVRNVGANTSRWVASISTDTSQPCRNFRGLGLENVSIVPDELEIRKRRKISISPRNLLDPFSSASDYVRYIFLTFREDFIGPLCRAIQDYTMYLATRRPDIKDTSRHQRRRVRFWNRNVRLYKDVEVLNTALSNDMDVDFTIRIDTSCIKNVNYRLKFGSLVTLSCNDFQTIIFAIVKDRDVAKLKKRGLLNIHIIGNVRDNELQRMYSEGHGQDIERSINTQLNLPAKRTDTNNEHIGRTQETENSHTQHVPEPVEENPLDDVSRYQGRKFTMLESTTFYEAYRRPLEALKEFHALLLRRESSLPFKKQLLELSKCIGAPKYLEVADCEVSFSCMKKYRKKAHSSSDTSDFSVQTLDRFSLLVNTWTAPDSSDNSETPSKKMKLDKKKKINQIYENKRLDQPATWPRAKDLGLDQSQYDALRSALTKEVALIQGPPGTGKTTLGIRIAEFFLENEHLWREDQNELMERAPLLLLSYTNHALDQFLSELLDLPVLENCEPNDVVRVGSRSECEKLNSHILSRLRKDSRDMNIDLNRLMELRRSRSDMENALMMIKDGVVHEDCLRGRRLMSANHYQSIGRKCQKNIPHMISWLHLQIKEDLYINLSQPVPVHKGTFKHAAQNLSVSEEDIIYILEEGEIVDDEDNVREDYDDKNVDVSDNDEQEEQDRRKFDPLSDVSSDDDRENFADAERDISKPRLSDDESSQSPWSPQVESIDYSLYPYGSYIDRMAVTSSHLKEEYCNNMWDDFSYDFRLHVTKKIQHEIEDDDVMSDEEEKLITDVWQLAINQRWRLYRLWLSRLSHQISQRKKLEEAEFKRVSERVVEQGNVLELNILKRARVVAMTTTAAARMTQVLQQLGPRIVLVEEAAQVSEAHLLASLSPACRHLIMIGDHQQLRPSYNNFDLTVCHGRHHIDVSMFERLCRAKVPFQRLELQHRMRPEISSLLVPTIYSSLTDNDNVLGYKPVVGMSCNVYFLDHDHPEDTPKETMSKRNTFEAEFLTSLYRHLRLQGYSEKEITVLALYNEQVSLLRRLIKKVEENDPLVPRLPEQYEDFVGHRRPGPRRPVPRGARVTAVDNFQGEENEIILLSLVRSNPRGKIGFLRENNRVCVALSRAKIGMFVVGNFKTLREKSPECWRPILEQAKSMQLFGSALPLKCRNHDVITMVASKNDFETLCGNGGCTKRCDFRKECGHSCEELCHDPDLFHSDKCPKPCTRTCYLSHRCPGICGDPCLPCKENVTVTLKDCGHLIEIECHQSFSPICTAQCEKTLKCGHRCQAHCGLPCTNECNELVKVTQLCDHEFQIACCKQFNSKCTIPCKNTLSANVLTCGHTCSGKCGDCFGGRLHVPCKSPYKTLLVCGHESTTQCSKSSPPCTQKCRNRCSHSRCSERCGEPCTPCAEPCDWKCKPKCKNQLRCNNLCKDVCDRPRCNEPCKARHGCQSCKRRYQCRGLLCEDNCPRACPKCDTDIWNIFFGTEEEEDAIFYQMTDCECVFEVTGLDQYMDLEDENIVPKTCPRCKSPILTAKRYRGVLNKTHAAIEQVKEKFLSSEYERLIKCSELRHKMKDLKKCPKLYEKIWKFIVLAETMMQMTIPENQINFIKSIISLVKKLPKEEENRFAEKLIKEVYRYLGRLVDWTLLKQRSYFSDQQLAEFQTEIRRAELLVLMSLAANAMRKEVLQSKDNQAADDVDPDRIFRHRTCVQTSSNENQSELRTKYQEVQTALYRLLRKQEVLSQEEEARMRTLVQSLHGRWLPGLGVTEEERVMIVKAMEFTKGHWFKCPNGHVYAIGECGGAMENSKCPECHQAIGGSNHKLSEGNRVATEMDGALYGAWSEQANLANYDPNNFA